MLKKVLYSTVLVLCLVCIFYWQTITTPNVVSSYSAIVEVTPKNTLETLNNLDFTGVNQFHNSIVKITVSTDNGLLYGTGFFISDDKIVTTAHCLQTKDGVYAGSFMIRFSYQQADGTIVCSKTYKCQVDTIGPEKDIVIGTVIDDWVLSISEPLALSEEPLNRNDSLICYGYPNNYNLIKTSGTFSRLENISIKDTYQNTHSITNSLKCYLPVDHGNSGSPLINDQGYVVGIVFCTNLENHITHAINTSDVFFVSN